MKVFDLDGNQHKWTLKHSPKSNCSSYHRFARDLLKEIYPLDTICEELILPGLGLTVDFFLPLRRLGVEVQGEQHYKFNKHFHKDEFGFGRSRLRDNDKKRWFEVNNLNFVELNWENQDEWRNQIVQSVS